MLTTGLLGRCVGLCVPMVRQYQTVVEMSGHARVAVFEAYSTSLVDLILEKISRPLHISLDCQDQRPILTK